MTSFKVVILGDEQHFKKEEKDQVHWSTLPYSNRLHDIIVTNSQILQGFLYQQFLFLWS